jgi:hypothetical protein
MCYRDRDERFQCPQAQPGQPWNWCQACRDEAQRVEFEEWLDSFGPSHVDGEEPEEPPCPLESHQQVQYQSWLAGFEDQPCFSLKQVRHPSPN